MMPRIAEIHHKLTAGYAEALGTLQRPGAQERTPARAKLAQAQAYLQQVRDLLDHDAASPADLDDAQGLLADTRRQIRRMKEALRPSHGRLPTDFAVADQLIDLEACADGLERSVGQLDRALGTLARRAPRRAVEDDFGLG